MTRAAIIQSSYIPWRGYFDFIRSVDVFVFYDDVQYSTGGWRNRNRLKTAGGLQWITVPVHASVSRAIDQTAIARGDWRARHRRQLAEALGPAKHFDDAMRLWEGGVAGDFDSISKLNIQLTLAISEYLGITTRAVKSRDFQPAGSSSARLIDLLKKLRADEYLSGPTAKGYIDEEAFRAAGIQLEYKSYDYAPYPQIRGAFEGAVTVLDLIANTGRDAPRHLASASPNLVAVPSVEATERTS
jgi:WbqC-like protein